MSAQISNNSLNVIFFVWMTNKEMVHELILRSIREFVCQVLDLCQQLLIILINILPICLELLICETDAIVICYMKRNFLKESRLGGLHKKLIRFL
jgi:hypothetical protein